MLRPLNQVNRCVKVWNDYHLREWGQAITGAVMFIAGSIVGTIALKNNTLPWAIFDFVIGIAGLVMFFTAALDLFFILTSSVMLSFQETLAQQLALASQQKSTVDVGTMTTSPKEVVRNSKNFLPKEERKMLMNFPPKENRKMLMTFPSIDRSKNLECERHPQMKYRALLDIQEKDDSEFSQIEKFQCPVSVHASEDNSQDEPIYYDFDDSYNMKSLTVEDSSTNKLSKDGTEALQEFLANGLRYHYENRNFLRCVKTLNLSPRKRYSVAAKFQSLSSKLRRKMVSSSPECEMSLLLSGIHFPQENSPTSVDSANAVVGLTSVDSTNIDVRPTSVDSTNADVGPTSVDIPNADVGQSFVPSSNDMKPDSFTGLSPNRNIQMGLKSTSSTKSPTSAMACSVFSVQNRSSHFPENLQVPKNNKQQHSLHIGKMPESLLKTKSPKCSEVCFPNTSKSSDFLGKNSLELNRESNTLIDNSDQLSPTDSNSEILNDRKLYIRSKRKPLISISTSMEQSSKNFGSEHVKRFY